MLINFYQTLIPNKWQVYWCTGDEYTYSPCTPIDTPANYDCKYGLSQFTTEAWIGTAPNLGGPVLDWSLADYLTGTASNELNAIWYMMMLGGDLGWDLQHYEETAQNGTET